MAKSHTNDYTGATIPLLNSKVRSRSYLAELELIEKKNQKT